MRNLVLTAALSLFMAAGALADPAPAATQPTVDPKAAKVLATMSEAYGKLKTLSLAGTVDLKAEIGAQKLDKHADFTASFLAPVQFRHEIKDEVVAAGNGEKIYIYLPANNLYTVEDSPKTHGARAKLSDFSLDVRGLLGTQDMSLALALSDDAAAELNSAASSVTSAPDVVIDGQSYPAVLLTSAAEDVTVVLDPSTHLLRRVISDQARGLRTRGADVKSAAVTINYTQSIADGPVKAEQFAFTPPPTAQEQKAQGATANALVGQAAPHFKLSNLDGAEVSDDGLKGKVYVLDFWATWCGPCRQSLPGLDEIYKKHQPDGVKIFAVNQEEEAGKARDFVASTKLSIPVLLDTDGKVGAAYGADAIPETVVVGRDGVVKNVFVGSGNEEQIAAALTAAIAAR